MQTKPIHLSIRHSIQGITLVLLFALLFTLGACTTTSPPPPAKGAHSATFKTGVPGGVIVNTVTISARVKMIDTGNRRLMLLKPNGETVTIAVGPEAVNFDQIRKGDMVKAILMEEVVVYIDEEGASVPDGYAAGVALAGGLNEFAERDEIRVFRKKDGKKDIFNFNYEC